MTILFLVNLLRLGGSGSYDACLRHHKRKLDQVHLSLQQHLDFLPSTDPSHLQSRLPIFVLRSPIRSQLKQSGHERREVSISGQVEKGLALLT
jgi:hypothetical protein